ncbi:MAG TPA: UvrD-helicase domain-containing protein, partial [bacterium]|nr:UvrD-helicase domain-containing protein [bacterium]
MDLTDKQRSALALDRHIALRAGAGSGKTAVLVERYLSILSERKASVDGIAAITFTEKAAAQLKGKIASEVARRLETAVENGASEEIEYWEAVNGDLNGAHISTIHAFCAGLLREYAIAAGVDPSFKLMDDVESGIMIREAVETVVDAGARSGDESVRDLARLWSRASLNNAVISLFGKRRLALDWANRRSAMTPAEIFEEYESVAKNMSAEVVTEKKIDDFIRSVEPLTCIDESNSQYEQRTNTLQSLMKIRADVEQGKQVDFTFVGGLSKPRGSGCKGTDDDTEEWKNCIDGLRDVKKKLDACKIGPRDEVLAGKEKSLSTIFTRAWNGYENAKRHGVLLDYDDLLEKVRLFLQKDAGAAREIGSRFKFMMVDEFQDTDPLQWEIVSLISGARASGGPSNVFFVGDDKQSIYSFRGADIRVFSRAEKSLIADADSNERGKSLELDVNFRSHPLLMDFFNAFFPLVFDSGESLRVSPRISYNEIGAGRRDIKRPDEKRVMLVKMPDKKSEPGYKDYPSNVIALKVSEILASPDKYLIYDSESQKERPAKAGDIAVLIPGRTSLSVLENSLRKCKVPFRVHGGIGFYGRREVSDLINLLRCASDPRDEISLAGVLRSPFGKLSDEDLLRIHLSRGDTFREKLSNYLEAMSERSEKYEGVSELIETLSPVKSPVRLLADALDGTGAWSVYASGDDGFQRIMNIEKMLSLAREFESKSGGMRTFMEELDTRMSGNDKEPQAQAAEMSLDSVKIMTVHAAKGLEFPIVMVAGLNEKYQSSNRNRVVIDDVPGYGPFAAFKTSAESEDENKIDTTVLKNVLLDIDRARIAEERKRLLYVACTRAKDYLFLFGLKSGESGDDDKNEMSWSTLINKKLGEDGTEKRRKVECFATFIESMDSVGKT